MGHATTELDLHDLSIFPLQDAVRKVVFKQSREVLISSGKTQELSCIAGVKSMGSTLFAQNQQL